MLGFGLLECQSRKAVFEPPLKSLKEEYLGVEYLSFAWTESAGNSLCASLWGQSALGCIFVPFSARG